MADYAEHYHVIRLIARSQTLSSTDYPTYKIHVLYAFRQPIITAATISCSVIGRSQCAREGVAHW